MLIWRVNSEFSYYPPLKIVVKMGRVVRYLEKQTDWVNLTELCDMLGISDRWIFRAREVGILTIQSEFYEGNRRFKKNAVKYWVKLKDAQLASTLCSIPVKKPKMKTAEDRIAERLLKDLEAQDATG
jgi:hypothetical protein